MSAEESRTKTVRRAEICATTAVNEPNGEIAIILSMRLKLPHFGVTDRALTLDQAHRLYRDLEILFTEDPVVVEYRNKHGL